MARFAEPVALVCLRSVMRESRRLSLHARRVRELELAVRAASGGPAAALVFLRYAEPKMGSSSPYPGRRPGSGHWLSQVWALDL